MAQWVPQNEFSSITSASRSRTAYLAPVVEAVVDAVVAYFDENPDGEEVTLAVLKALGKQRLAQFAKKRTLDRVKQDVGLLVAQTLVDLFGATRVHTLRRGDRKAASARRNTWPDLAWVNSFSPHRVVAAQADIVRILLDTSVVRKVIHGDADALDVDALKHVLAMRPVSIADGALAELAVQLIRGSVSPADWSARIAALDELLDSEFPVAPGGKELAAFWGAHTPVGMDLGEARAYYRAAWAHLRAVSSAADLDRASIFHAPSGRAYSIRLDRDHVEKVLADAGAHWTEWVVRIGELVRGLRKDGDTISEEDLRQLTRTNLCLDMGVADAAKLDLVIHVLARRALQAATNRTPYNPNGESNDPLDLDLLFGVPLPAWICTSDMRLHRLVRSTESPDRDKVMTPAELLQRLAAEAGPQN